jgi:hypothetical protein
MFAKNCVIILSLKKLNHTSPPHRPTANTKTSVTMIRRFIATIPLEFYAAPDDTGALHAAVQIARRLRWLAWSRYIPTGRYSSTGDQKVFE